MNVPDPFVATHGPNEACNTSPQIGSPFGTAYYPATASNTMAQHINLDPLGRDVPIPDHMARIEQNMREARKSKTKEKIKAKRLKMRHLVLRDQANLALRSAMEMEGNDTVKRAAI